ncbi:hypothetical protein JCM14076_23630 [Methylosoma difficile]
MLKAKKTAITAGFSEEGLSSDEGLSAQNQMIIIALPEIERCLAGGDAVLGFWQAMWVWVN